MILFLVGTGAFLVGGFYTVAGATVLVLAWRAAARAVRSPVG